MTEAFESGSAGIDSGEEGGDARARLVHAPDGGVFLVEGGQRRTLLSSVIPALAGVLGPAAPISAEALAALPESAATEVGLAAHDGLDALVECAPPDTCVVVGGATRMDVSGGGRAIQRIYVQRPAHDPRGKPPDGLGVLDQLALAEARGATHLVLPMSSVGWLKWFPELAGHLGLLATIVACNDAGALWSLPPLPPTGDPKIFCIGLTKTGTSSLHVALSQLGLRSFHWGDLDAHPVAGTAGLAAARAIRDARRHGERLLQRLGEEHDAYSDVGALSARFDLADAHYPGSRFILTVRNIDDWIDSRWRQAERHRGQHLAGMYQGSGFAIDERAWRAEGQAHRDRVEAYFASRDDLLVLDICAGDGWERLAPFLGRSVPSTPFPTENVKHERSANPRPHLVRRRDGAVYLVENSRRRSVTSALASAALERVLGSADPIAPGTLEAIEESLAPAVIVAAPNSLEPLLGYAPPDSQVVIGGSDALRDIEPPALRIDLETASPGPGGKPPDGLGALDQLAVAWVRGGTHLLLPTSSGDWLRRYPELARHLGLRATIVACNDAGVLWVLPPLPSPGDPKIFCIGLPQTGTVALHTALSQLGLRSFHWGHVRAHARGGLEGLGAARAVRDAQRDGERLLHNIGEESDAYSDINALSVRFDLADMQYPGSRFILTVSDGNGRRVDPLERAHRARVEAYFADRDDLLVLDIGAGDGWDRLAPFLGRPVPSTRFPRPLTQSRGQRFVAAAMRRLPSRLARRDDAPSDLAVDADD